MWPSSLTFSDGREVSGRPGPCERYLLRGRRAGRIPGGNLADACAIGVDEGAPTRRVVFRQQPGHWNRRDMTWISHPAVAVGKRELQRLVHRVQIGRAVVPHVANVHPFEDVERLQHHEALRVGRTLVDLDAFVVHMNGRVFMRFVAGEILCVDEAAVGLHVGGELLRDAALVERGAAFRTDFAQRGRKISLHDPLAHLERPIAVEPDAPGRGHFPEHLAVAAQRGGQRLRHGEAAFGERRRGRHDVAQRLGPVRLGGKFEGPDGSGHADRQHALAGKAALSFVEVDGGCHGGEASAVDELHFARLGQVDEDEHVAAKTGHLGFDQALGRPRGERGVDGVAAGLQHPHADLGSERVSRRDHAVIGEDGRAPRLAAASHRGALLAARRSRECQENCYSDEPGPTCHSAPPCEGSV